MPVIPPRHSRENGNPRVRPDRGAGLHVIPPSCPRIIPSVIPVKTGIHASDPDQGAGIHASNPDRGAGMPVIPPSVIPVKTGIHAIAPVIPATPRHPRHTPSLPPCHSRENGNPRDCPRHSPPHPAIPATPRHSPPCHSRENGNPRVQECPSSPPSFPESTRSGERDSTSSPRHARVSSVIPRESTRLTPTREQESTRPTPPGEPPPSFP